MRTITGLVLAMALVAVACGSGEDGGVAPAATSITPATTSVPPTTTATTTTVAPPTTVTTTTTTTTTTTAVAQVVLATEGTVTVGETDGETVLKLTHDVTRFADSEMARESEGGVGWQGGLWVTVDDVRHQAEISRWWPPDQPLDVILLTSNPSISDFVVFDALTLEGELDRFALHGDCRTPDGDVGVALLSFDYRTPTPLIAWGIDRETMTFVQKDVVEGVELGDCWDPKTRE